MSRLPLIVQSLVKFELLKVFLVLDPHVGWEVFSEFGYRGKTADLPVNLALLRNYVGGQLRLTILRWVLVVDVDVVCGRDRV